MSSPKVLFCYVRIRSATLSIWSFVPLVRFLFADASEASQIHDWVMPDTPMIIGIMVQRFRRDPWPKSGYGTYQSSCYVRAI